VHDADILFDDLVRGPVRFAAAHVPDYVIVRANGEPLYTLVNPVDDSLMKITHVLRGEDLLPSTPRQIVLYDALKQIGVGSGRTPAFGHLPTVLGEGNRRLSKRDKGSGLAEYQQKGYLPEGLLNYLALLGWAIAADRDVFSLEEMVEAFDIADVNPNPARFDLKKAEAINAAQMRLLPTDEITHRVLPFLKDAGVVGDPVHDADAQLLELAMPLVAERINKLAEAVPMLDWLFVDDDHFTLDPTDAEKLLDAEGRKVVRAAHDALEGVGAWSTDAIQTALQAALVDELGLKPRHAYGPVRVAVTGRRISPPLFESLELLGRERGLGRLRSAMSDAPA
jgi:glutamyl-tRNA synthetase